MPWTILVVGDDATSCSGLVEVLAARGYRSVGATGADAAEHLILHDGLRPAVIVVDGLHEPRVPLVADPRAARAINGVPVVVLSRGIGLSAQPPGVRAAAANPLELQSVLSTIHDLCHRARSERTPYTEVRRSPLDDALP